MDRLNLVSLMRSDYRRSRLSKGPLTATFRSSRLPSSTRRPVTQEMPEPIKEILCAKVDAMAPELLAVSREIHANPELAFQETRAAALLVGTARGHGLEVETGSYGLSTAFEATFGPDGGTTTNVAVLAEYDALPGIGHACGHNLIATSALGAALALASVRSQLPGRVTLLGTPAEEKGGGKELMARNGAFENVDAAMMMHPAGINLATMASICVAEVDVVYHGRSAHASAMPTRGPQCARRLVAGVPSHLQPAPAYPQFRTHPRHRGPTADKRPTSSPTAPPASSTCARQERRGSRSLEAPGCKRVSRPGRREAAANWRCNGVGWTISTSTRTGRWRGLSRQTPSGSGASLTPPRNGT